MTITTFYQAICNGYDKPRKFVACKHVQYEIRVGNVQKQNATLWNREHKLVHAPMCSDFTVYMDGNISPLLPSCHMHLWVEEVMKDCDLAICRHPQRKCAYVEIEACVGRKKITEEQAGIAQAKLFEIGLPKNFGLWDCGVIMRRTHADWVEKFMTEWMQLLVDTWVLRDQIWLPAAMQTFKIPAGRFKTVEMNLFNNNRFLREPHKK